MNKFQAYATLAALAEVAQDFFKDPVKALQDAGAELRAEMKLNDQEIQTRIDYEKLLADTKESLQTLETTKNNVAGDINALDERNKKVKASEDALGIAQEKFQADQAKLKEDQATLATDRADLDRREAIVKQSAIDNATELQSLIEARSKVTAREAAVQQAAAIVSGDPNG